MAALLLTCDLVNLYHGRKEQRKKKAKQPIKGLCERNGGTGIIMKWLEIPTPLRKEGKKKTPKTTPFTLVVVGERKSNNTGSLHFLHSTVPSVPE